METFIFNYFVSWNYFQWNNCWQIFQEEILEKCLNFKQPIFVQWKNYDERFSFQRMFVRNSAIFHQQRSINQPNENPFPMTSTNPHRLLLNSLELFRTSSNRFFEIERCTSTKFDVKSWIFVSLLFNDKLHEN